MAASIRDTGGRAVAVGFDVTDYDAVAAGVAAAAAALGPVDILVNNAGNGGEHGMVPTQFRDSDPASWRGRSGSTSPRACTSRPQRRAG